MTSIEIVGADGENKPENKSATKSTVASDAYRFDVMPLVVDGSSGAFGWLFS